jgi:hypothetical protein
MGKVFVGQIVTIKLDTKVSLSGVGNPRINYVKPNGDTGYWPASVTETTKLSYLIDSEAVLDVAGSWVLWGSAGFAAGNVPGEAAILRIHPVGT